MFFSLTLSSVILVGMFELKHKYQSMQLNPARLSCFCSSSLYVLGIGVIPGWLGSQFACVSKLVLSLNCDCFLDIYYQ